MSFLLHRSGSTGGVWKRGKAGIMRHRQPKGPGTARPSLNNRATSRPYDRRFSNITIEESKIGPFKRGKGQRAASNHRAHSSGR